MFEGTVSLYKEDRGYGFIKTDDDESYFFHFTQLAAPEWIAEIEKGVRVTFDVGPSVRDPRKNEAKNIRFV